MPRVLALSSFVARGAVGLQATLPALAGARFEVIAMPTIVLSNHPGHKACAGTGISPASLAAMTDALEANGWLCGLDAIFTGYLPSPDHVAAARRAVALVKRLNPAVICVADPVLGDDPGGLYVSRETAEAVRDLILPLADLVTPNRFELAWLTGLPVDTIANAQMAARALKRPLVAATSLPAGLDLLANILVSSTGVHSETVALQANAPHGTGDYFAGCLLAAILDGKTHEEALHSATQATQAVIDASRHSDRLIFETGGLTQ
jgi:pyridoxine kinase